MVLNNKETLLVNIVFFCLDLVSVLMLQLAWFMMVGNCASSWIFLSEKRDPNRDISDFDLSKLTNTSQILTKINRMFFSNFMQHRISIYHGLYSNFQRVIDIFIFHFKSCICYFSFFHQMIVLKQLWKMLFILSKKDLFVLKILNFFAFLPSPFFPFRPLL